MTEAARPRWRIALAQPQDAARVAPLALRVLPGAWTDAGFGRVAAAPGGVALVAWCGDPAIGYLEAHAVVDELHVMGLAVDPAWRRRGIASALLRRGLALAAARGATAAHLEVRASNTAARRFYARFGFVAAGRRPRYYPNGEDALLLSGPVGTRLAVPA